MTIEKISKIETYEYTGNVYNIEVEPNHPTKDDQFYLCADTGIIVHNCHPRDNIALRWLSKELNLGYDLFGHVMEIREKQAKNMANELLSYDLPIVIVGKAYKPAVAYTDGSPGILVGSFIDGKQDLYYMDPLTGDMPPSDLGPAVYLLAHNHQVTYSDMEGVSEIELKSLLHPVSGSVIVDPWRSWPKHDRHDITVVHYGNTR